MRAPQLQKPSEGTSLEHREWSRDTGLCSLQPRNLPSSPELSKKKKKCYHHFFFHPEANGDQVAFCTRFTYNAITAWTKCQSTRFQGCRPCEPGPRMSLPGSGSGFSPDLPMVTHTTLPGSPQPAVSGDLCKRSGRFCPKCRFCLNLHSRAVTACSSCCQNPDSRDKRTQFYMEVSPPLFPSSFLTASLEWAVRRVSSPQPANHAQLT